MNSPPSPRPTRIPAKALTIVVAAAVVGTAVYLLFSGDAKSWFDSLVMFVYQQQRGFSRSLSDAVAALRTAPQGATLTLVTLGFMYGIFHAIGPGHGKAVISAYALTHETHFRRTIAVSFAAAFVQGFSAIAVVGILSLMVAGSIHRFATAADDVLNPISFAAVTAIGVYLLVHGVRVVRRDHANAPKRDLGHDHEHEHHEHCGCGHNHAPTPAQIDRASTPWRAATIALAVGIRPCSGAILVLVLSFAFGFPFSGIAAVLAMSLGTAITVSTLAVGAQSLRWPLAQALEALGVRTALLSAGLMIMGGAVITAVGATLLHGALNAPTHPFF